MRVRLAVAVVAVSALAWPPSRQVIGEWLITAGVALAFGPPPPLTPDQVAAGERRLLEAVERLHARGDRNGHGPVGGIDSDSEPI